MGVELNELANDHGVLAEEGDCLLRGESGGEERIDLFLCDGKGALEGGVGDEFELLFDDERGVGVARRFLGGIGRRAEGENGSSGEGSKGGDGGRRDEEGGEEVSEGEGILFFALGFFEERREVRGIDTGGRVFGRGVFLRGFRFGEADTAGGAEDFVGGVFRLAAEASDGVHAPFAVEGLLSEGFGAGVSFFGVSGEEEDGVSFFAPAL